MTSNPTGRSVTSRSECVGQGSMFGCNMRILLRSIDYSIMRETEEWSHPDRWVDTSDQLAVEYELCYCQKTVVGAPILRYTGAGFHPSMANLIRRRHATETADTVEALRMLGSLAIDAKRLLEIHYNRDEEVCITHWSTDGCLSSTKH